FKRYVPSMRTDKSGNTKNPASELSISLRWYKEETTEPVVERVLPSRSKCNSSFVSGAIKDAYMKK
ncbi:17789_t:CDS:1, partial [Racocetra fulgida]